MKGKKIGAVLTLIALLGVLVGGCWGRGTPAGPGAPAAVVASDGLGRQVEVSGPVNRVVSFYPIATHFLFVLGVQNRLVSSDGVGSKEPFFLQLAPELEKLPRVGGEKGAVNIESLLALKPDLVLVKGRDAKMVNELSSRGLRVFAVVAETPEQVMSTMENLGRLFGQEQRAQRFVSFYRDVMNQIEAKTKSLPDADRPTVYFAGTDILKAAAGDMYQSELIAMAGGRNVAAGLRGGWVSVSAEQLIQWNPDFILVPRYGWVGKVTPQEICADPRFQTLKAVKNHKVMWFPSNLTPWDWPAPQNVLGLIWLAKTLHPELFPDLDPLQEANRFYQEFYGRSFTDLGGKLD
ncbi:ABC transporter substrate-binding protein [Ammonifex thiophilus]|uniref:Fe/B12 periplasmic-binding domain-containing protein n=1 Tax=Ammonifex thiophilus TaxID=444093 RepID=A0A3D8P817_9THEO|nr:ABC transporter substrate-binding protein [Ammonifex thiophilus]RDV84847.1 hypothetical protein DXX99_02070 [Ammonifex thiophilus]